MLIRKKPFASLTYFHQFITVHFIIVIFFFFSKRLPIIILFFPNALHNLIWSLLNASQCSKSYVTEAVLRECEIWRLAFTHIEVYGTSILSSVDSGVEVCTALKNFSLSICSIFFLSISLSLSLHICICFCNKCSCFRNSILMRLKTAFVNALCNFVFEIKIYDFKLRLTHIWDFSCSKHSK